jgi:hypothetical protein
VPIVFRPAIHHLAEVMTGTEDLACSGEHYHSRGFVGRGVIQCGDKFLHEIH